MEKIDPAECMFCSIAVNEKFKLRPLRSSTSPSPLYVKTEIELADEKAGPEGGMYNARNTKTAECVWFYPPILCIKHKDN